MHLHLHLKETLFDYGPAHATWCFSFERYNGILASVPNNKNVEIQVMNRFLRTRIIQSMSATIDDEELKQMLPLNMHMYMQQSLSNYVTNDFDLLKLLNLSHGELRLQDSNYQDVGYTKLLDPTSERILSESETEFLCNLYQQLNPGCSAEYVSPFYTHSGRLHFAGDILGSVINKRTAVNSSVVAAYWPYYGDNITRIDFSCPSVGKVLYYMNHSVTLKNITSGCSSVAHYTLAYVQWMDHHPQYCHLYGVYAIACNNSFNGLSLCCYIPVLQIFAKCASYTEIIQDETVFIACPIPIKLSM